MSYWSNSNTISARHLLVVLTRISFSLLFSLYSLNAVAESRQAQSLKLGSVNAMVYDLDNGKPLFQKNSNRGLPIASITKLMTAIIVLESGRSMTNWIRVKKPPIKTTKNIFSRMRLGSKLRRKDMLRISLMSSENRASALLAENYPGATKAFVAAMNAKAKALNMTHTKFVDPTGLSEKNVSTAADLVKLLAVAYTFDIIKQYTQTPVFTAHFSNPKYGVNYMNTNLLVRKQAWPILVSKTGYIREAGRCLAMLAEVNGKDIAMVLLDSYGKRTPVGDAGRIKHWLETGKGGKLSKSARAYEQEKQALLAQMNNSITP